MNYPVVISAIARVFAGCMLNVITLESLVVHDPGIGNLITFLQFLFVAVYSFIFYGKFGSALRTRHIPIIKYVFLMLMFYTTSVANNYAFDFNVPMPLHIIFRSGSLIANMIMGYIILKKRYAVSKYVSVLMITAGIITCTLVSVSEVKRLDTRGPPTTVAEDMFWWCVGIGILTLALLLSAVMGIFQEDLYKRHGKHSSEALFYTHVMSLPFFLPLTSNLLTHWNIVFESPTLKLGFYLPEIPVAAALLIANVISQHMCISAVYTLTTECPSLIVTLVITLRKFASLIYSVLYFGNVFSAWHWTGTLLVFFGTLLFSELHLPLLPSSRKQHVN